MESDPEEIWKQVDGYELLYEISNFGRCKSHHLGREKILKPWPNTSKHLSYSLHKTGTKCKSMTVHRLVGTHFIDNPDEYPVVDHIDRNKENNHFSNLRWCTISQNNSNINHKRCIYTRNRTRKDGSVRTTYVCRWNIGFRKQKSKTFTDLSLAEAFISTINPNYQDRVSEQVD